MIARPMTARVQRAAAARRQGRFADAETALRAILDAPLVTQAARVEAYLELGKTYDRLERRRDAQACYRRILALTDDWTYREPARTFFRKAYTGQ